MHPQKSDYVEDNEMVCFGVSEDVLEERHPMYTEQAKHDIGILYSWFPKRNMDDMIRPAYRSEWNFTWDATRANIRCGLGLFVIRELPIKNFYTRIGIGYLYCTYFIIKGIGRGMFASKPTFVYNNEFHTKGLLNHPDLFWWNLTRVLPKDPMAPDAMLMWKLPQQQVYHQYHRAVYRYRWRRPRFVQWDGSMN